MDCMMWLLFILQSIHVYKIPVPANAIEFALLRILMGDIVKRWCENQKQLLIYFICPQLFSTSCPWKMNFCFTELESSAFSIQFCCPSPNYSIDFFLYRGCSEMWLISQMQGHLVQLFRCLLIVMWKNVCPIQYHKCRNYILNCLFSVGCECDRTIVSFGMGGHLGLNNQPKNSYHRDNKPWMK